MCLKVQNQQDELNYHNREVDFKVSNLYVLYLTCEDIKLHLLFAEKFYMPLLMEFYY